MQKSESFLKSYQDEVAQWLAKPRSKSAVGWKLLFSPSGRYRLNPKTDAPRIKYRKYKAYLMEKERG